MTARALRINGHLEAWSYSRLRDWLACNFYAGIKHVLGRKEPGNDAMRRGLDVGKQAERYVLGELPRLPPVLENFAEQLKAAREMRRRHPTQVIVEEQWAFTRDWRRTTWFDGDAGSTGKAWARVKMDLGLATQEKGKPPRLKVVDHKTGKFSPEWNLQEYLDQLELYVLAALLVYADVEGLEVTSELWFLDQAITYPPPAEQRVYTAADVPTLKKAWEARVKPMLADRRFAPRPSSRCGRCHFRAANGGPCLH